MLRGRSGLEYLRPHTYFTALGFPTFEGNSQAISYLGKRQTHTLGHVYESSDCLVGQT